MAAGLRIVRAGPGVTLQDGGRQGYLRFGVNVAGPMDPVAFATANRAAGAADKATAIEVSLGGLEIVAEETSVRMAVAGAAFDVALGERSLPSQVIIDLEPGVPLRIRPGASGMWCYVGFGAPLAIQPQLGSTATHVRTALGGLHGRALGAGDLLSFATEGFASGPEGAIVVPWLEVRDRPVRLILGPQDDYFSPDEVARFLSETWTISNQSDRMGCFLDGTPLQHRDGFNIISDGITMGAIQVPGSGRPLVLMADRQPTGGYPKIATIIWSDLGRFAQYRPGSRIRFEAVTWDEAVAARRRIISGISTEMGVEPLRRKEFTSEFLLGRNLAGSAWPSPDLLD